MMDSNQVLQLKAVLTGLYIPQKMVRNFGMHVSCKRF